jgi:N-dimethylarginine dimethylaminohydrolase
MTSPLSEIGVLRQVVLKHARDAFISTEAIAAEWRDLNFSSPPIHARALAESDAFEELLRQSGADVRRLPPGDGVGLDSIYVRDASLLTPAGVVLGRMGKPQRVGEPAAQGRAFADWGIPVAAAIQPPGRLEGGDVVWLDARTAVVGRGYRTNDAGIEQLRAFVGAGIELVVVALPHWRGPGDVFHLMSLISPVDVDLAVVYSPLLPVPFRELLLDRGYTLIEVPEAEFDSMGANVLALSPRRCVAVDGNPRTRALLERAGADVLTYSGAEISLKGGGGPTCLTRPLSRAPVGA